MCDFIDDKHNCYEPDLGIERCEICDRKTCGWSRVAISTGQSYTLCGDCCTSKHPLVKKAVTVFFKSRKF